MSHQADDEAPLDTTVRRALRDADDLLPTSEAEVARAERALPDDVELPASLRSYRAPNGDAPPRGEWRRRPEPRWRVVSHVAVAALGAAAAGVTLHWVKPAPPAPVTSAGGELVPSARRSHAARVPLVFKNRCERECCAGTECRTASEALRSCPSGARCIACGQDYASGGPYRLRVGAVVPSEIGQKLLPLEAPLELCLVSPTSPPQCLPAVVESGADAWRLLERVTPIQDLLTGLTVELRKRGEPATLASWKHAVSPTPEVMCKGLAVQLGDTTDVLARVSVFVEQSHFVELSRAAAVPLLLAEQARFDVSGIAPHIYETSSRDGARFALVVGPVDKSEANALRWQALDHGIEAKISHGLDFLGTPRPAP
jgi:hypothetical protein